MSTASCKVDDRREAERPKVFTAYHRRMKMTKYSQYGLNKVDPVI